ncbi:transposase [Chloroflexota bacterium]
MRSERSFSFEFKRWVVEEITSSESRSAQFCRRYNITSIVLYHWKKQYSRSKLNNEPTEGGALKGRIEKLECLVGKLTPANEFM